MHQGATTAADRRPSAVRKRPRGYREGQRRFQCDVPLCDKTFARLEHLKRHQSTAHDPNHFRYNCSVCGHEFSRQDILKRHQLRRHGKTYDDDLKRPEASPQSGPGGGGIGQPSGGVSMAESVPVREPAVPEQILSIPGQGVRPAAPGRISLPGQVSTARPIQTRPISGPISGSNTHPQDVLDSTLPDWTLEKPPEYDSVISANQELAYKRGLQFGGQLLGAVAEHMQKHAPSPPKTPTASQADGRQLARLAVWDGSRALMEMAPLPSERVCGGLAAFVGDPAAARILTPAFLREALGQYWSRFHARWPVLHRPTFSVERAPPHLVLAVVSIGCYFCERPGALEFARRVHESLRFRVYMECEFKPPTALWVYQALLLIEIFELLMSTAAQHEMALQFRHVLVAAMRRSVAPPPHPHQPPPQTDWDAFIYEESRRRLAYCVFMLDTHVCMLFHQKPLVYVADLPRDLLAEEAAWEAESDAAWRLARTGAGTRPLKAALFAYLRGDASIPLSPWNMAAVLHALVSVATNAQHCGGVFPAADGGPPASPRPLQWRPLITGALATWRAAFAATYLASGCFDEKHPYALDTLAMHTVTQISQHADLSGIELLVVSLAGPRRQPPSSAAEQHRLFAAVARWAQAPASSRALVHCLDLVGSCLVRNGQPGNTIHDHTGFIRAWCVYLATLTVWAYDFAVTVLSRSEYAPSRPLTTAEYLGRLRAMLPASSEDTSGSSSPGSSTPVYDDNDIDTTTNLARHVPACDANVLLHTAISVLETTEWEYLQRRLDIIRRILTLRP